MSNAFKTHMDYFQIIDSDEDKIKYLCDLIVECSEKYYEHNTSSITNKEFDTLTDMLKDLDSKNPILTMTGWGYKVGVKGIKHPYHPIEGISDKRKIVEGDTVNNGEATYSSKLDGCSIEAYYNYGKCYMAITRGGDDGKGKDVTHTTREKVPAEIENFTGYVRMECCITYENFKNFPEGDRIRNSATGIMGAKTKREFLKYVDAIPVSVYDATENTIYHMGSNEYFKYTSGFKHKVLTISSNGVLPLKLDNELLDQLRCDYPVDGFVCYKDGEILCAYKYDNEFAYPKVLRVETKTQPTTKIFPSNIWIEETEISDCKVNKVTGKSGERIIEGKIGPGAVIEIVRSGEVVPNWTGNVIKESDDIWVPHCSYGCDDSFVKRETKTLPNGKEKIGANFFCTNPKCPSILDGAAEKLIRHFAPKGFSDVMVEQMFEYFSGSTFDFVILRVLLGEVLLGRFDADYKIGKTEHQNDMIDQTMAAMNKREMSIHNLVSICSIEAFGKTLSGELEVQLQGCDDVNGWLIDKKEFTSEQVNNSKARDSWYNRHNLLCDMLSVFKIVIPEIKAVGENGTVCISGSLPSGTKKKEFAPVIESKGYTWVEKLKKDTTILICSKPDSNKAMKAKKDGTEIMTEEEFLKL